MKRFLVMLLLPVLFLTGCAQDAPEPPMWFDAYSDDNYSVRAMYTGDDYGSGIICFELTNNSPVGIALSSVLGFRVEKNGEPVEISYIAGFDRLLASGETACCTVHLACQGSEGCSVSIAVDFAAGKWIEFTEIPPLPEG